MAGSGDMQGVSDKEWLDKLGALAVKANDTETLVRLVQFAKSAVDALFDQFPPHVGRLQGELARLAHYVKAHPYGEKCTDS